MSKRVITPADIIPDAQYAAKRAEFRRAVSEKKRNRRVALGPYVTFYFECYDTMWLQVQEMVHIEKGGAEQIPGELEAYNPLIPNGQELTATFMIEIDDPIRRKNVLGGLGGIEETTFIRIGNDRIAGTPEADADRTSAEGKASSVQFVHFPFTPAQIMAFKAANAEITLGLDHPNYRHMTILPDPIRSELATDFA